MKTKIVLTFIWIIIILSFLIGIFLYNKMPDQLASHWNAKGEVDDYISKFWGLFLVPIISLAIFLLFLLIPKIDPLKENIQKFREYFNGFIMLIMIFLFYIYILTILWNLEYRFNMTIAIIPAIAVLFYYVGILLEHAKRNWFVGIRTPWTLSSEVVWNKTHKLGAKLYKILAVVMLISMFFEDYLVWIILGVVLIGLFVLVIYSYFEFKKLKKN